MSRLIGPSPHGLGAQVGAVCLHEDPIQRDGGSRGTKHIEALVREGDHARERDVQSQRQEGRGMLTRPGERVEDSPDGSAQALELLDEISLAIPTVNHDRKTEFGGESQVAIEPFLLPWKRGMVPVAIQTRLADGDDPRAPGQFDDLRPVFGAGLGNMVGLDAHRGEDAPMSPGNLAHGPAVGRGGADCKDLHQARGPSPTEHPGKVGLQAVVIKVGVGVDKGMDARDRRGHASDSRPISRAWWRPVLEPDQLEAVARDLKTLLAKGFQQIGVKLRDQVGVEPGGQVVDRARAEAAEVVVLLAPGVVPC